MGDFNCNKCGSPLEWADTFRTEGGIQEGYLIEYQVWTCEHCEKDFVITQEVDFSDSDVKVKNIVES